MACNINYSSERFLELRNDLTLLYKFITFPGIEQKILKTLLFKYRSKEGENRKLLFTEAQDFCDAVDNIVCLLCNASINKLPSLGKFFRDTILATFFDMSRIEESKIVEEEESESRTMEKLDDIILDMYGNINNALTNNLINLFKDLLGQKLIYNRAIHKKLILNEQLVNREILKFKEEKFKSVLKYLKAKYLGDQKLLNIKELYSNGIMNASDYFYVMDLFRNTIKQIEDRNHNLNILLSDKITLKNRVLQEALYKQLIQIIQDTPKYKTWFDEQYNDAYINAEAQSLLFYGDLFSDYYLNIKDFLHTIIPTNIDALSIIAQIENPNNDLLKYMDDFMMLYQFDTLLKGYLGENFGINEGFILNSHPETSSAIKYMIKQSKKHQRMGWETSGDEDSESHTGITTKNILNNIFLYNYKNPSLLLSLPITMSYLLLAWNSLVTDVLNNKVSFAMDGARDVLRLKIDTLNDDVIGKTSEILGLLFDGNVGERVIDTLLSSDLLNDQHKHMLYSFYNLVLNTKNPRSIINSELDTLNDGLGFLDLVNDLTAILFRNVNNNYIDSNQEHFKIKAKFNWDNDLFNLVEEITHASKLRLIHKLGKEQLSHYLVSVNNGHYISTFNFVGKSGKKYSLGFSYKQDASNIEGLFSQLNNLTSVSYEYDESISAKDFFDSLDGKNTGTNILTKLSLIELNRLKSEELTEEEQLLKDLFGLFDHYLNLGLNTEIGLDAMELYRLHYLPDNKHLFSKNYLNHFLKLALRAADVDFEVNNSDNIKLSLENSSKYAALYKNAVRNGKSDIFEVIPGKVLFKVVNTKDIALSEYTKRLLEARGESSKSTSRNKSGASVPNYNISRAGSELNRRLERLKQLGGPASSLLFVNNRNSITVDPVIDDEVTTLTGEVMKVKSLSTAELFLHAILDKFYLCYTKNKKICFQPTVYSDKTTFLNYLSDLGMFDDDIMDMSISIKDKVQLLYKNTFFAAHNKIFNNVIMKYETLINYASSKGLLKSNDIITDDSIQNARVFLRNRTSEELLDLVYNYNQQENVEPIELELDKDYRDKKAFCDLNEVIEYYDELFNNSRKLKKYFEELEKIFLEHLDEYGVDFVLFDSQRSEKEWVSEKPGKYTYVAKILKTLIPKVSDRKKFVDEWVHKGKLIHMKDGVMNPFLEKFFYIEGLFSNNLRLSLSGSEINHPDKAYGTLFNRIKDVIDDPIKLEILLSAENITDFNVEEFKTFKTVSDLNGTKYLQIYDKTIIEIINTELGTLFKRNVIIPATLQHPTTGMVNGPANDVVVCVIKDIKAPVNNLRNSDSIDAQDGGAQMSSIQVILENNALGEQRVGTNRKPIWDDQTGDLTSFLAKFASFGQTNAIMLQSLRSDSSLYKMFKLMHNIPWNGTIDLTKNITQFEETPYSQTDVTNWFTLTILQNLKLYYKNQYDLLVQIVNFGKDANGYFTEESILGKGTLKVYHYFVNETSEHTHTKSDNTHDIDSLYELFVSLGGVNCVDAKGNISEFSHQVLTNFVINVGRKKSVRVTSINDIEQPLKDKYVAYAFNSTAVKNGAKNVNGAEAWKGNKPLRTFKVSIKGLGIQLNADHDVDLGELTEFSLVVAACAAYGKDFDTLNEIYYGLAKSAEEASKAELKSLEDFFNTYSTDKEKAKYELYKIIGKLIVKSKSNSDFDLTNAIKKEVAKTFQTLKSVIGDELRIPFSDPSIYRLFITNITSIINSKSIKRKHPGSGYVMVPSYNIMQYFQVWDGTEYKKYMFKDVLKRARLDYKNKLVESLETWCLANGQDPLKYNGRKIYNFNIPVLLQELKDKIDLNTIAYYTINTLDNALYNERLVETYLKEKQKLEPTRDKSWFMPTDIVQPITPTGELGVPIDLSDMKNYYDFKNRTELEGTTFKLCITRPNNLKPSLVRWQYNIDAVTGLPATPESTAVETKYMTIYDHPVIRQSWNSDLKPSLSKILDILDLLDQGKFELDGLIIDIVPESLENTEAEIIMGNMYASLFDVQNNSLADILEQKEKFFRKKTEVIDIPKGFYDMAFVKDNGNHTLITFLNIKNSLYTYKNPFTEETVDEKGFIYANEIKIGRYIPSTWKLRDGVVYNGSLEIDPSRYKITEEDLVLERIDFVERLVTNKTSIVNGQTQVLLYDVYKISELAIIARAFADEDINKLISDVLKTIYDTDQFIDIRINTEDTPSLELRELMANSLISFGDVKIDKKSEDLGDLEEDAIFLEELRKLPKFERHIVELRELLMDKTFKEKYDTFNYNYYVSLNSPKKQYTSFLNSLYFISSRIPALSLLSFMPMKCVGWIEGTNNSAYVSYIQTWLLGSDYDIDKAYIMGQSFTENGLYIGWSSLFDYSSIKTLLASKTLPLPKGTVLEFVENPEVSIENELADIVATVDKASKIRKIGKLITKIDKNLGKYSYTTNSKEYENIINKIKKHQKYKTNFKQREAAYKNVASANIYNIVHNIRNRDLAYSPITMSDLLEEADKSPKGKKTKLLNMGNPFTKYIMLNLNLVGKEVIGIAANGEKDWFNITYYYHQSLRNNKDPFYLKINKKYSRIAGRASNKLSETTVKHIPDLWKADAIIKNKLMELFYNSDDYINMDDKYVDQLISQLLSAATDNAKELILAKINAGTNLAKYHLHLIMLGFSLDDIIAFMTSPAVELIDKYSRNDYFKKLSSYIDLAVKTIRGDLDLSQFIVPEYKKESAESRFEREEARAEVIADGGKAILYHWILKDLGELYTNSGAKSLHQFLQNYILVLTGLLTKDFMVEKYSFKLPESDNYNTLHLFDYVNKLIDNINSSYKNGYNNIALILDLAEFEKITKEANETSTLASVWLKLNLGIPQTDLDLIKLIHRMNKSISTREEEFGITSTVIRKNKAIIKTLGEQKSEEEILKELKLELAKIDKKIKEVAKKIVIFNPSLEYLEVYNILTDAYNAGLYGNFDLYQYLNDDNVEIRNPLSDYKSRSGNMVSYRELAGKYYNVIKATWNILDIVNSIPHYKLNLDLLNYTLLQRHIFSNKAKLVDQLIDLPELKYVNLSDKQYKDIVDYADKIIIMSYLMLINGPIDVSEVGNVKLYNTEYKNYTDSEIYLNSLNGIDSFRRFIETEFLDWAKVEYPNNVFILQLVGVTNHGKSIIKTLLDLSKIDLSLANKLLFNRYLLDIKELLQEKRFGKEYSTADLLMLYNLIINGTKLGGKYLSAVFNQSVLGSVLEKYFNYLGKQDYDSNTSQLMPTGTDLLMFIAPKATKYSLNNHKEPFVKVPSLMHGYDMYERYYDKYDSAWKYKPSTVRLNIKDVTPEQKEEILYEYNTNSVVPFPKLHNMLLEGSILNLEDGNTIADMVELFSSYIRQNKVLIYKIC